MIKNKNHNSIYFLTTLSVYLGLVFVGATPQALAYAQTTKNAQPHSFEINAKTSVKISKLKYEADFEYKDLHPFQVSRFSTKDQFYGVSTTEINRFTDLHAQIFAENNQVTVISNLPRASI